MCADLRFFYAKTDWVRTVVSTFALTMQIGKRAIATIESRACQMKNSLNELRC